MVGVPQAAGESGTCPDGGKRRGFSMIPIRDTIRSRTYPVVNTTIIAVNVAVYLYQMSLGQFGDQFIVTYGLIPARYTMSEVAVHFSTPQQIVAMFSFMFLHGGLWHLIGNMWSLYIFGDNVEDRVGHGRYIAFYVLCGLASGLSHLILNLDSTIPTVGASGAIAGVMGAYLLLYPGSRILTLIPIFFIPWFVEIPAFFFLGIWFLLQFLNAAASSGQGAGVAWWAHIGGFVFGMILIKVLVFRGSGRTSGPVEKSTGSRNTHRLQTVSTAGDPRTFDLLGSITLTPGEAEQGALKLVNIPWSFHSRLVRVRIPSDISDGSTIRLKGMGRRKPDGDMGDLYLKVNVG